MLSKRNNPFFLSYISGDGDFKTIKSALDKGAQGFITKPIEENKIIHIIENI